MEVGILPRCSITIHLYSRLHIFSQSDYLNALNFSYDPSSFQPFRYTFQKINHSRIQHKAPRVTISLLGMHSHSPPPSAPYSCYIKGSLFLNRMQNTVRSIKYLQENRYTQEFQLKATAAKSGSTLAKQSKQRLY